MDAPLENQLLGHIEKEIIMKTRKTARNQFLESYHYTRRSVHLSVLIRDASACSGW